MSMTDAPAPRPLAIDLFAGAGGLSLGLEQAGFDVVTAVEYDPVHAATHEFNFPQTKVLCADVSAPLTAERLRAAVREGLARHGRDASDWNGELDLLAGGPPCQGFSLIGKRLIDDKRNQLVFHFYRLVVELRPRYFIMENVPGMAKGGHASVLSELISELEDAGYHFSDHAKFRVLNAADFGVPQERHRLFLIGTRNDQTRTAEPPTAIVKPVPKRAGTPGRKRLELATPSSVMLPTGPTVGDAILDLPDLDTFDELKSCDAVTLTPDEIAAMNGTASSYARRLRGLDWDLQDFSYARVWDPTLLTSSMRTVHTEKSILRFHKTDPGNTEPVSRFYKLDPEGLCNTLRAGSGSERGAFTSPRPLHPLLPRVLSNREAARLHSFPDWFRVHTTKWHGFRQIGNAVAPLVGRAVGAAVMRALDVSPYKPEQALELGDSKLLTMSMSRATEHLGADTAFIPAKRKRGALPGESNLEAQTAASLGVATDGDAAPPSEPNAQRKVAARI
ncbi:DNA cytosine methyltransferase [Blastococcus haudaquaticus]|nr:DNA cytosine methyltransferase [Blastococcus haudaquaticus]